MAHTITCVALPNGRTGTVIRLSAFFSLRLRPDPPGSESTLGHDQFSWLVSNTSDWPALIRATNFTVTLGKVPAKDVHVISAADSTLFRRIFSTETRVQAFTPTNLSGLPIFSWPVMLIHDTLKGWYGSLGASAGDQLPSLEELRVAFGNNLLGEIWYPEVGISDLGPNGPVTMSIFRDRVRNGGVDLSSPTILDAFRLLTLFHHPAAAAFIVPPQPTKGQGQWSSAKKVPLPSADELAEGFHFHQIVAALGEYPELLERLGLVVDLEAEMPEGIQPGDVDVAVAPGGDAWTQAVGPASTILPITEAELTANDFRAKSKSGLLSGGMLDLSGQDFHLIQVDVDGLALKAINFSQTMAQMPLELEPGEPNEMGVPAPRTAGLALIRTGQSRSLAERLVANSNLNSAIEGSPPPDGIRLSAEHLARGYYVDVYDDDAGVWRSLCWRTGTYLPTDGGPPLDPIDDEGVVQLAVTQAPDAKDTGQDQLYVQEMLIDWKGWSLVAPRPGKKIRPDDTVSTSPLPPDEVSELADPTPVGIPLEARFTAKDLPRLRYGHQYRVRLRVADLAGNSVPYQKTFITGGTRDSSQDRFMRFDPVPSPALALVDSGGVHFPDQGESMHRLAIRTFNDKPSMDDKDVTSSTERLVFPPATTQIEAEAHGTFDGPIPQADGTFLVGLDKNAYSVISAKDGALPQADAPTPLPPILGEDKMPSKYSVAQLTDPVPYLPDPLARQVALRWLDRLGELLGEIDSVDWFPTDGWPDAVPFRIRLQEGDDPPSFDWIERVLHLPVPKGDVRVLRLSSQFNEEDLPVMGLWSWVVDEFTTSAGNPDLTDLQKRAVRGRHWMLTPWRDVELVHAVQQPLGMPKIVELQAIRKLGRTWAGVPFLAWIHRASTVKIDMFGDWNDPVDDPKDQNGAGHIARTDRAFEVRVPVKPAPFESEDVLDRREEYLHHEIGDTRYRRVRYRIEATSRYREYFEPDANMKFSRRSSEVETFVENAAPPVAPKVLYAVPTFGWNVDPAGARIRRGGGLRIYLSRPWFSSGFGELLGVVLPRSLGRLRRVGRPAGGDLDDLRGHVSEWGSDPLWESPPVPAIQLSIDRFKRVRTNPEETVVPSFVPEGELPLPGGPFPVTGLTLPGLESNVVVDVAPHDVAWDPDRKLWYSDIELDIGDAYFPFVRLALARYHPRSVYHAHLSQVVLLDFLHLAPDRTLAVTPSQAAGHAWTITLSGPPYTKSSATVEPSVHTFKYDGLLEHAGMVERPFAASLVTVSVEGFDPAEGEDFGWRTDDSAIVTSEPPPDGTLWHGTVALPGGIAEGERRRLVVTEKEQYIADPEQAPSVSTEQSRIGDRITYADIVPLN